LSNLEILKSYREELFEPSYNWPEYQFLNRTYSRWALNEIINLVESDDSKPIGEVISEFWNKMDDYSEVNDSIIFKIARNLANDVAYLFM